MAAYTYEDVTPVGSENPKSLGWYEYSSLLNMYFATTDTSVQSGKTYYSRHDGYLVKIGTYKVPFKYIKADTYQCVWSVVDFDSYRDANGEIHRDAVSERRIMKVEWETPDMSDTDLRVLLSNIKSQYIVEEDGKTKAKSCNVTAWMPEEQDYKQDKCYLTSDVNFTIRYADTDNLRYEPTRFAFIGYGTSTAT